MKNNNENLNKAREFCQKVKELASLYNLPFFVVTNGASATNSKKCEAVKKARENHIKWEIANGFDSKEEWENFPNNNNY